MQFMFFFGVNTSVFILYCQTTSDLTRFIVGNGFICFLLLFNFIIFVCCVNCIATTLEKTYWDKSWKSRKFKKWLNFSNSKFSPLPPNINVESSQFFCQNPKTLSTTLIWGRGVFSLENRFSILSQQFCPRL